MLIYDIFLYTSCIACLYAYSSIWQNEREIQEEERAVNEGLFESYKLTLVTMDHVHDVRTDSGDHSLRSR